MTSIAQRETAKVLQRTVHRQKVKEEKVRRSPVWLGLSVFPLIALAYITLQPATPRVRDVPIAEDELRAKIAALALPPGAELRQNNHASDDKTKLQANLGRMVYESTWLSRDGKSSCASCHGSRSAINPPTTPARPLVNLTWQEWFGSAGASDSLEAAVLQAFEQPHQLDSSRAVVAAAARALWPKEYQAIFGTLPSSLPSVDLLVGMGGPEPQQLRLDVGVAATGLASIGSPSLLDDIIEQALREHIAPAAELAKRTLSPLKSSNPWQRQFSQLSAGEAAAVTKVFVNLGHAVSTYIKGFVAVDSPFDQFAHRLTQGSSLNDALGNGFTTTELQGLKLFLGPGKCIACHDGVTLSDQSFHNLGLSQQGEHLDAGRAIAILQAAANPESCLSSVVDAETDAKDCARLLTLNPQNTAALGAFRTPSLRQLASKSRYMHDNRFPSIEAVLSYLNDPRDIPAIGHRDAQISTLELTKEELAAIGAFLNSLNGKVINVLGES